MEKNNNQTVSNGDAVPPSKEPGEINAGNEQKQDDNESFCTILDKIAEKVEKSDFENLKIEEIFDDPKMEKIKEKVNRIIGGYTHEVDYYHNQMMGLVIDVTNIFSVLSEISKGDLDIRAKEGSDNEIIAELARILNQTSDHLGSLLQVIKGSIIGLNTSINQLVATAEEQSAGAAEQATSISETSSTVEEFAATARQIEENSDNISHVSNNLLENVKKGLAIVESSNKGMREIKKIGLETSKRISQFERKIRSINEVVDMINNIANTTNILTINASIEAAKSGEAGKGFAVVAHEMREISRNVVELTKKIHEIVNEIDTAMNSLIMSTEIQTKKIDFGVKLSNNVKNSFAIIENRASKAVIASKQNSLSAKQQSVAASQIVTVIKEISNVTNQTSIGAKQLQQSAQELSNISNNLEEKISTFKISEKSGTAADEAGVE